MKNIVLTGYMASGKSTVGKMLSKKLGYTFYDTDELIEKKENISINEIFQKYGEEYFRKLENDISKEFNNLNNSVIATGGGFIINPENIKNISKNAVVFNLNISDEIVVKRYNEAKGTRPLMENDEISGILKRYNDRKEQYKNCDIQIDINNDISPDDICDIIIEKYKNF